MNNIVKDLGDGKFQSNIHCTRELRRFVVGTEGSVINRLRDEYDIRIYVPQQESNDEYVIIIGSDKENILKARKDIRKIIENGRFTYYKNTQFLISNMYSEDPEDIEARKKLEQMIDKMKKHFKELEKSRNAGTSDGN